MMKSFDNTTYLFIPFRFNARFFNMVCSNLAESSHWTERPIDLRYFYRFVANKVNGTDGQNRCRHYTIDNNSIGVLNTCCKIAETKLSIRKSLLESFSFKPIDIELFVFMTGVCLIAVKAELNIADLDSLIDIKYVMKQATTTLYRSESVEKTFSLADIAKESVAELSNDFDLEFTYYTNPRKAIAYIMTLCYCDEQPTDMELLYLQNSVPLKHTLSPDLLAKQLNKVSISDNIVWAVTGQSAVCMCTRYENDPFMYKAFPKSFQNEYKYLFVFLLHQKYALYSFLTQIDTEMENSIDKLKEYKKQLSDFKTYFVFSQVSELINYQLLHEEASKAFALDDMYEDVNEPLLLLDEVLLRKEEDRKLLQRIRSEQAEKDQAARDNRLNLLLMLLSMLSIVSAFSDSLDLASKMHTGVNEISQNSIFSFIGAHYIHIIILVLIVLWSVFIIYRIIRGRRKKGMKNNCLYLGAFFQKENMEKQLSRIDRFPLQNPVKDLHVTIDFLPKSIPYHFFGERIITIVKGYGHDDENEALLVEIHSDNKDLEEILSKVAVPHITLSVSAGGKAKNSARLHFSPVKVFEITGVFGEMTKNGIINTNRIK